MPYNRNEFAYHATVLRGASALKEMLDNIGRPVPTRAGADQEVAKVMVDNEMPLRALLTFALDSLRDEM